jgi:hypothetical protein
MNRRLLVLVCIVFAFTSCSKKPPTIADVSQRPDISPVPSHFSQNFLIEKFTSSSAGQAPRADFISDSLLRFNPGRVFCASIHLNDQMMDSTLLNPYTSTHEIDSFFNPSNQYPFGMVNRNWNLAVANGVDGWGNLIQSQMGVAPQCGIALEAKTEFNGFLDLTVHVGFAEDLSGEYHLHGYIVENTVRSSDSLYDQLNDFSFEGSTPDTLLPFYAMNDTIHQYTYGQVVRKIFSVNKLKGDAVPQAIMQAGAEHVTGYRINLSGINTSNSYILVFIDKYGDTPSGRRIINVQRVNFGESQDWN